MNKHRSGVRPIVALVLAALLGSSGLASAKDHEREGATAPSKSEEQAVESERKKEPEAMDALKQMGAFLRSQESMRVASDATTDVVLDSGQKVQLHSTSVLRAHRPDKLRLDVESDRKTRQFFYDGKTFTLYSPRNELYASVDAPPTIKELAETLSDRFDIDLPLADLFYWGTDDDQSDQITTALDIGPSTVDGVLCEQYAFRQPGLDWQVWIEKGSQPLPHKLLLVTTDDPARPQHEMTLSWQLGPELDDSLFTFVPNEATHRIDFQANPEATSSADEGHEGATLVTRREP